MGGKCMSRTIVIFVLAGFLLLSIGLWAITSRTSGSSQEIVLPAIVLILVGFAVYRGFERVRSSMRKEPYEDELSRKTLTKCSSLSYYVSLYLWLFMMYISDRTDMETHTLIGAGIGCMALIFLGSWIWVKTFGWKNE